VRSASRARGDFILTIEGRDHLWEFIRGELFILVLVEIEILCQIARDKGYTAKFDPSQEAYPLCLEVAGADGVVRISSHILARIGMEFASPEWIVLCSIEGLERTFDAIKAANAAPSA
jgi:hypothetical protein